MSRSRRKTSICGLSMAESNKADKTAAHRRWRKRVRQDLQTQPDSETQAHEKSFLNPWLMAKDGKVWFDARKFKKLLRK